jgi:hypothetical protein
MDKFQFIKSIIDIHNYFQTNFFKNSDFLLMIEKCFNIKKTTFYDWYNDNDIKNTPIINDNNNKLINNNTCKLIILNIKFICLIFYLIII